MLVHVGALCSGLSLVVFIFVGLFSISVHWYNLDCSWFHDGLSIDGAIMACYLVVESCISF